MQRPLKPWTIALGIIGVLILVLVLMWDWNWFKGLIERAVGEKTDRKLSIGDLDVRLAWPPRLHVRELTFSNPPWATERLMLQVPEAEFSLQLLPLFAGKLVFPELQLSNAVVALERDSARKNNWTFSKSGDPSTGAAPVIGSLAVNDGLLRFHDPEQKTDLRLDVQTTSAASGDVGLRISATGKFKGQKLEAVATGGRLLSIAEKQQAFPIKGRFSIGSTRGTVDGKITNLAELSAANLWMTVDGHSLDELFPLLGVSLPATPPYSIKGQLKHQDDIWQLHGFKGRVGDSDLAGDVDVISRKDGRKRFNARLVSQQLDLDDLGGFIGAPPQTGSGETSSPEQKREAVRVEAKSTLPPDKLFKLDRLRAMDASVHLSGKSVRGRDQHPIDDLELQLELKDGVLRAKPLNFGVASGNVISTLKLDARSATPRLDSDIQFKRIQLNQLFPKSELMQKSEGVIGGRAVLAAKGKSFADLLADADGTLGLATKGGDVSNLILELLGLDGREVVQRLIGGDKNVRLLCGVADFDVKDGVMQTKSVVVDTTDTKIIVEGQISLRDETMDLNLLPQPKDISILSLRSPIHVKGTFKDPDITPDKKLAARVGLAVILGLVGTPAAALIPLIETGRGEDADCDALIHELEAHAKTQAPEEEKPGTPAAAERREEAAKAQQEKEREKIEEQQENRQEQGSAIQPRKSGNPSK